MQLVDGHLNFSPTDLVNHLNCRHLTGLERERASGRIERPFFRDEAAELVAQHGHLHEQRYLEVLRSTSLVEVIEGDDSAIRAEQTEEAMRAGVDVIYQATFAHEGWSGRADFLVRVDNETEPSALGPFRYEVYDTKLARTAKATALVQLAEYSERVTRIQGVAATHVHLVLGDSSVEPFPLADIAPYHRSIRRAFLDDLDTDLLDVYPEPVENCSRCQWRPTCRDRRIADDHLSLVADLGRTQARVLEDAGIATLAQLADSSETQAVAGMQPATFRRLHHQARLQLAERTTGTHVFELLEPDGPASGLEALPVPTDHDLFFDIEGDPFLGTDGLEYLFGYVDTAGTYTDCWASSVAEEKAMLEEFVDHVTNCVEAEPSMHVFHFGHYEPTTLKRLAARHGTREHELDVLLRRELFVDLHRVTRQALRASVDSYSIKRLEVFYQDPRDTEIGSGVESAVVFEAWLGSTDREDRTLLNQIVEYNRDDCVSTLRLRGWLEDRRPELEVLLGRQAGRPAAPTVDRSAVTVQVDADVAALQARLLDGISDDPEERDDEQEARWRLSHLLTWHRRESRTEWWAYFDRRDLDDDERIDNSECIAQLEHVGYEDQPRGLVWNTYRFDPAQELKIRHDAKLIDPATESGAGTTKAFDQEAGTIVLSRRRSNEAPHPRSLMVGQPPSPTGQEAALRRLATALLDEGADAAGVAYRLLRRQPPAPPPLTPPAVDDPVLEACERANALDGDFLAIQGPPGAGKTYTGSAVIRSLVASGKTVAVCANSHAVINHLLQSVLKDNPDLRILKKGPLAPGLPDSIFTDDYGQIEGALDNHEIDILAGTAFALCRDEFAGRVDTVVVDEAGQMSLANAMAVSQVARNLILLGDPQQLSQPTKAAHPPGTNSSALSHILGEHDTMPAELGMFLPETRRMHPAVCDFISERFYEGRLGSHDPCSTQALEHPGVGLHLELVDHARRASSSPEEAAAVGSVMATLLGQDWTDQEGRRRKLSEHDILVVAPYNAQVRLLQRQLGPACRVGTVDMFQGQEAPVVIYSMASSAADLAPRGMDFLYDLHRLNVAISRA